MANVPPNDPNVDAPAIVLAPVNPDHAPAQPVGLGDGFAPHWIGNNIPNNQNGWIEEDAEEEEEDPEEDSEEDLEEEPKDDDDDMEMDDDAEPIPPIALFGQNFHFGESSSTANLLTGNSKIVLTGPKCPNLGTVWKRLGKMEKLMYERIDTEGRIKKKFKEQDRHFLGLGCDNIKMDRTVRNVMSDLSGVKKMLQNRQKSKGSFPLPLGSQVREPPAEPSTRPIPAPYPDDPYVVTRDAAIADTAIATSGIDDDDDITPMDSQPHEPYFMKCSPITFCGNKGAVGLIRWIEKMEMVFTVSKCTKANKVVFAVATFQDRALTWWNSQVATLGIEAVTRKT
nr:putative reverse transcriptase domain-containing protein [Tanacetum cinerariifolium]